MKQLQDKLLHLFTRHTNLTQPYSDYIRYDKFPEQNTELLNTVVTINYRNYYVAEAIAIEKAAIIKKDGEWISARPSDDYQQLKDIELRDFEKLEAPFVSQAEFRIVRADAEAPYRLIAISTDYQFVVVNSTELDEDGEYKFKRLVSEYPLQIHEFIGLYCHTQYVAQLDEYDSYTIRVDESEPCYSVLVEYLPDDYVRFVLGDEAMARILNDDGSTWEPVVHPGDVMSFNDIAEYRKNILKGKKLYGNSKD